MTKSEDLSIKLWHYMSTVVMSFLSCTYANRKEKSLRHFISSCRTSTCEEIFSVSHSSFRKSQRQLYSAITSALKLVSILKCTVFPQMTGRSRHVQRSAKRVAHSYLLYFVLHTVFNMRQNLLNVLPHRTSCFMWMLWVHLYLLQKWVHYYRVRDFLSFSTLCNRA